MHELPIIERILGIALKHCEANGASRIACVALRVGELTDLNEEWMQRYFAYVSKNTPAEGARLAIEWAPVIFRCNQCEKVFPVQIRRQRDVRCPSCASGQVMLLSGREFFVKHLEVL
jgi:hydrogenase nickel incorporation protein HypA/HybF